jgi:hypothetical protein
MSWQTHPPDRDNPRIQSGLQACLHGGLGPMQSTTKRRSRDAENT